MQKKYRLKSGRVFNYLHKRGSSVANKRLVLVYAPSKYPLKVGFIVSKKVGKATVRNKVRRRLREVFRALIPFIDQNTNYVVIARAECASSTFAEIANALLIAFNKADALIQPIDETTRERLCLKQQYLRVEKRS